MPGSNATEGCGNPGAEVSGTGGNGGGLARHSHRKKVSRTPNGKVQARDYCGLSRKIQSSGGGGGASSSFTMRACRGGACGGGRRSVVGIDRNHDGLNPFKISY